MGRVVWNLLARGAVVRLCELYAVLLVKCKPLGRDRWNFRVVALHGRSL